MTPLEVLAQNVKMRREQLPMTQVELASALAEEGMTVDATAVAKLERGDRAVRIDQLLALASALSTTPGHLLAPAYGRSLTVGRHELGAAQVLAWFAGDPEAKDRPATRLEDVVHTAENNRFVSYLLEEVGQLTKAIEQNDGPAIMWLANRAHNTLAVLVENQIPQSHMTRIWDDYTPEGEA